MMRFILNHSTSHSSDDAFVIWIKIVLSATSAIKAEKQNDFAGVDADRFKLWKVEIPGDHIDPLSNLSLESCWQ
uniref:Uncharacterized protein n=1 Tax=Rhizophagus irregularis (strain DAOM 181602 / DAOM 197198 / MUCL 43194) TaxID=747089 RepID=U9UGD3_RHIID